MNSELEQEKRLIRTIQRDISVATAALLQNFPNEKAHYGALAPPLGMG
ncbi:hypothetical protein [Peribacillus asahii]|nr:hypothetical protein [Peribacillus asahii]USK59590.1 hypothetical protein LIT37_20925 [Peribacillus asahii]